MLYQVRFDIKHMTGKVAAFPVFLFIFSRYQHLVPVDFIIDGGNHSY